MRKELIKAREYLYNLYNNSRPEKEEKSFWNYIEYTLSMKTNYENINERLLESIIIKHKKNIFK
jgi:hypothetical protein